MNTTHAPEAFQGNDMQITAFVTLAIPVTTPPHRVGDHSAMTPKGIAFERK